MSIGRDDKVGVIGWFLVSLFIVLIAIGTTTTGCVDNDKAIHIGDHVGPPGAKVVRILGDDWFVIELEGRFFLIQKSSGGTGHDDSITAWPETR